jgi:phosphate transport system substrate-binding protein
LNRKRITAAIAALGVIAVAMTALTGLASARPMASLSGAGSTFVNPLVSTWTQHYKGSSVSYSSIGSGGGIAAITARTVDFGASDAPLTPDQAKACNGCVQIPWALAATTVSYNLPGLSKPLRLSGPVIADIYLGSIKNWNDSRIQRLNPGAKLPSTVVRPFYRSDGSGDTYAFTEFLSHVSPVWKSKVGVSTVVSWPTGAGAAKNSGMVAAVQSNPGAIGYVAIGNAVGAKLAYADVQNQAGAFVRPSTKTIAVAGQTAQFEKDNSASIVDPPASAKTAYPISTFTYVIFPRSSSKLSTIKPFLNYAVTAGQKFAPALEFAPVPQNVAAKDKAIIKGL